MTNHDRIGGHRADGEDGVEEGFVFLHRAGVHIPVDDIRTQSVRSHFKGQARAGRIFEEHGDDIFTIQRFLDGLMIVDRIGIDLRAVEQGDDLIFRQIGDAGEVFHNFFLPRIKTDGHG